MRYVPERDSTARRSVWASVPWGVRQAVVWSGCISIVAVGLYVLGTAAALLGPLALALAGTVFLTAVLHPVFAGLRRLRLPASLAALVTVVLLIAALLLPVLFVWQQGSQQVIELAAQLDTGVDRLRDLVVGAGLSIDEAQWNGLVDEAMSRLRGILPGPVAGARTAAEVLGTLLLVLVLLFFLLKDGPHMWQWVIKRTATGGRTTAAAGRAAWTTLTSYARGTMIIASIDAAGVGLALVLLRVPLALPLTLFTFLGAFVPIIGAAVAGSLAVLVALAARGPGTALAVAAAVIAVQQIEGNLLQPMIMRRQVSLHPVVILVAVTAGLLLGGIAGAFVAVPVTAVSYSALTAARRPAGSPGHGADSASPNDREGS